MQRGFINLGLVVVLILAVGLGYFLIFKSQVIVEPESTVTPSDSGTVTPTPSATGTLNDLTPLPSGVKWSQPVKKEYKEYLIYDREDFNKPPTKVTLRGQEIVSGMVTKNFSFFDYYDTKLTDLDWLPDLENTTEGLHGNVWGYYNDEKHIIFKKEIKYRGPEIPESPYNCPCEYIYTIFIED